MAQPHPDDAWCDAELGAEWDWYLAQVVAGVHEVAAGLGPAYGDEYRAEAAAAIAELIRDGKVDERARARWRGLRRSAAGMRRSFPPPTGDAPRWIQGGPPTAASEP